jgi:phosphopantetheinyl transferase
MILLSVVQLSTYDTRSWGKWNFILSERELEKAASYTEEKAKGMFVMARLITRIIISQRLSVVPSEIQIAIGPYGRPKLKNNSDIDFNIAHSNGVIIVALSDEGKIGVDVEQQRSIVFSDFKSFLIPEEIRMVESSTSRNEFF